ncbi:sulfotransferase [Pseudomonadota bacterium]
MVEQTITPNIVIVGVTKAGSTSLFTYLSDHPDVCGSTIKEVSHFVTVRFGEPARPIKNYTQYFSHCRHQRYRLESSPAYFFGNRELAETMKSALNDVKVIIMLREPVSRCLSHFRFSKNMLKLPKDMKLDEYFQKCQEMPYEAFLKRQSYVYYGLASGIYSNYIEGWIETFGENLHICFFDDLKRDSHQFSKNLCQWLDIDETFYDDYNFVVENMGRDYHKANLQKLVLKFNKSFEGFFRRNIQIKRVLRNLYFAINGIGSNVQIDMNESATIAKMREYYAPHNKRLRAQLLKANVQSLPEWLETAKVDKSI